MAEGRGDGGKGSEGRGDRGQKLGLFSPHLGSQHPVQACVMCGAGTYGEQRFSPGVGRCGAGCERSRRNEGWTARWGVGWGSEWPVGDVSGAGGFSLLVQGNFLAHHLVVFSSKRALPETLFVGAFIHGQPTHLPAAPLASPSARAVWLGCLVLCRVGG